MTIDKSAAQGDSLTKNATYEPHPFLNLLSIYRLDGGTSRSVSSDAQDGVVVSEGGIPLRVESSGGQLIEEYIWRNGVLKAIKYPDGSRWEHSSRGWEHFPKGAMQPDSRTDQLNLAGLGVVTGTISKSAYRQLLAESAGRSAGNADQPYSLAIETSVKAQSLERDRAGRIVAVNYLNGDRRTFTYDADGLLSKVTGPGNSVLERDSSGKWLDSGRSGNSVESVELSENGTLTVIDKSGIGTVVEISGNSEEHRLKPIQTLSVHDFSKKALDIFNKIDSDQDGKLSERELALALEDPQFKGEDAQVVAALHQDREVLMARLLGHFIRPTGDVKQSAGINPSDLKLFEADANRWKQRQDNLIACHNAFAEGRLFRGDANSDLYLDKAEIESALKDSSIDDQTRADLEFLRDNYRSLAGFIGISKKEIRDAMDEISADGQDFMRVSATLKSVATVQTPEISTELYAKPGFESICSDAVRQSPSLGNCYFEAALASQANSDPSSIARMIRDNRDGTYTVTFPGAPDEPVTIKAPTEAELGLYGNASEFGTWAAVIQKAHGQYCRNYFWRRSPMSTIDTATATGGDGGSPSLGTSIALLTGRPTDTDLLALSSDEELKEKLVQALKNHPPRPVTAAIMGHPTALLALLGIEMESQSKTEDGFARQHLYSVLAVSEEGVIIRNPWGQEANSPKGTISIPLSVFRKNFSVVCYGK